MKGIKVFAVIVLGSFIALFAIADVFLYIQGRQSVEHVKVKEVVKDEAEDSDGDKSVVNDKMDSFTVTSVSKKITKDVSIQAKATDRKPAQKPKSVESVVKHSRDIYYSVNRKLKSYTVNKYPKEYTDYRDMKNNLLRKAITYPTANTDAYLKKYTAEYYYDKNRKLVFAFAYKKVKGKTREYRAYYGTDGKLYRFIDANGKITDYKKGKAINYSSNDLRYLLYRKGVYYIGLAYEGLEGG